MHGGMGGRIPRRCFGDILDAAMILGVFGDLHGAVDAMLEVVKRYEETRQRQVDGILQCGDLGAFSFGSQLDKATRRFLRDDPSELGTAPYVDGAKKADKPIWFAAGNHEDFDLLGRAGESIDPFGMIRHLPSGRVSVIAVGGDDLRVVGVDGIEPKEGQGVTDARGGRDPRRFMSEATLAALSALRPGEADILIAHEAPAAPEFLKAYPEAGSRGLLEAILRLQPALAFYGHYDRPPDPFPVGRTLVVGMCSPKAFRLARRDGAMGIIEKEGGRIEFRFVESFSLPSS